jgi:hypothetical protein
MTGRAGRRAREKQAAQLRGVLEQLEAGRISISGAGHTIQTTRQRLERRIRQLEGGRR